MLMLFAVIKLWATMPELKYQAREMTFVVNVYNSQKFVFSFVNSMINRFIANCTSGSMLSCFGTRLFSQVPLKKQIDWFLANYEWQLFDMMSSSFNTNLADS